MDKALQFHRFQSRRIYLLLTLAFGFLGACGASALDLPFDYLRSSLLIRIGQGAGSGLCLSGSNGWYLVTAKHVILSDPNATIPSIQNLVATQLVASIWWNQETQANNLIVDLPSLIRFGDVRCSTNRDVAVIKFASFNKDGVVQWITPAVSFGTNTPMILPPVFPIANTRRFKDAKVANNVFTFGYPISVSATSPRLRPDQPLIRKGILAGKNTVDRFLITDSPVYKGNSGGPVIIEEFSSGNGSISYAYPIIGIAIEFVPFFEVWENRTMGYSHALASNSGYTIVEPIDTALDMLW